MGKQCRRVNPLGDPPSRPLVALFFEPFVVPRTHSECRTKSMGGVPPGSHLTWRNFTV